MSYFHWKDFSREAQEALRDSILEKMLFDDEGPRYLSQAWCERAVERLAPDEVVDCVREGDWLRRTRNEIDRLPDSKDDKAVLPLIVAPAAKEDLAFGKYYVSQEEMTLDIREVECPRCEAAQGENCIDFDGPHEVREDLAVAAWANIHQIRDFLPDMDNEDEMHIIDLILKATLRELLQERIESA